MLKGDWKPTGIAYSCLSKYMDVLIKSQNITIVVKNMLNSRFSKTVGIHKLPTDPKSQQIVIPKLLLAASV